MFSYSQPTFAYEPYPICRLQNVLPESDYDALTRSYPDLSLFNHRPKLGDKYSLSERNNRDAYHKFLSQNPLWTRVHDYIKSARFVEETLGFLKQSNIDLDIEPYSVIRASGKRKTSLAARLMRRNELSSRFEFSVMGSQGGHIRPHTDEANKLVTLVISMIRPGEWDEAWGGGTQVCLPKDRTLSFNRVNRYLEFDQVDIVKNYEFKPNQCILFIKTYNSWHQVAPINAPTNATAMRRALTINIERLP